MTEASGTTPLTWGSVVEHPSCRQFNDGNEGRQGTGPLGGAHGRDRFALALISLTLDDVDATDVPRCRICIAPPGLIDWWLTASANERGVAEETRRLRRRAGWRTRSPATRPLRPSGPVRGGAGRGSRRIQLCEISHNCMYVHRAVMLSSCSGWRVFPAERVVAVVRWCT
jgi:hypothetical protein